MITKIMVKNLTQTQILLLQARILLIKTTLKLRYTMILRKLIAIANLLNPLKMLRKKNLKTIPKKSAKESNTSAKVITTKGGPKKPRSGKNKNLKPSRKTSSKKTKS